MSVSTTKKMFKVALGEFVKAMNNTHKTGEKCAVLGLRHFAETGDLVYLQKMRDAIKASSKTVNTAGLDRWCEHFAPILVNKTGHYYKDTSENANALDLPGAVNTNFWSFQPETPPTEATVEWLLGQISSLEARLEGKKLIYKQEDAKAMKNDVIVLLDTFKAKYTGVVDEWASDEEPKYELVKKVELPEEQVATA